MQQHNTEAKRKTTDTTRDRLYQVFKSDTELDSALSVMSGKLHIPELDIVLKICDGY